MWELWFCATGSAGWQTATVYHARACYDVPAIARVEPRPCAITAANDSLIHQGGTIWSNGERSGTLENGCQDLESAMEL
jgi:hypothetical protein